ncbi:unnamed protein product [Schistocephalus solidus]|uniref:Uncharacterized protein n=1 Tax=Schistocephalus solidus TaxID=70667 RepID=A0A183SUK4_SCHSO|nr:unnamed protein product [Schistocephalus solidus]
MSAAIFKESRCNASDSKPSISADSDSESSDSGEQTLQTSESERCDSTFHSNSLPLRRRRRRHHRFNIDFSDESDQWSLSDSLPSSQQQSQATPLIPQVPIACVECNVILLEDVDVKLISLQTAMETWIRELRCYTELENPNILISKTLASCR